MDLRNIQLFLAVYDAGNITVAAERIGMNQPAVSKAVQRMENELGVPLFEREARGVTPTLFADLLADAARDIDSNLRATYRRIDAIRDAELGEIVIGAGGTWQEVLLPSAVANLYTQRPKCRIRIVPGTPEQLVAQMLKGDLDLVLAPIDIPDAFAGKVNIEPLLWNRVTVIARADHALMNRQDLTIEDLAAADWVLPPGSVIRERFEKGFRERGIKAPAPAIECVDNSCLFQIVEATDLLSYVAELRIHERRLSAVARVPDNPLDIERVSGLITRRSSYMPPLAKELISEVRRLSKPYSKG